MRRWTQAGGLSVLFCAWSGLYSRARPKPNPPESVQPCGSLPVLAMCISVHVSVCICLLSIRSSFNSGKVTDTHCISLLSAVFCTSFDPVSLSPSILQMLLSLSSESYPAFGRGLTSVSSPNSHQPYRLTLLFCLLLVLHFLSLSSCVPFSIRRCCYP